MSSGERRGEKTIGGRADELAWQNENKTLIDEKTRHQNLWDEKYSIILQQLDEYQDEKDNPRKQVIDMEVEELYALLCTCCSDQSMLNRPDSFRQRFKSLIDQYELRELHFHSQMRTKELEIQFNLARFDREKKGHDKESNRTRQLKNEIITFSNTESDLRQQLNVYVDKFKQVGWPRRSARGAVHFRRQSRRNLSAAWRETWLTTHCRSRILSTTATIFS